MSREVPADHPGGDPVPAKDPGDGRLSYATQAIGGFDGLLRRHSRLVGLVLFILTFSLFSSNRSHIYGGDTRGLTDLAWWAGQGNAPRLNGHPSYRDSEELGYWAVETETGLIASVYPTGSILFVSPLLYAGRLLGFQTTSDIAPIYIQLIAAALMAGVAWAVWFIGGKWSSPSASLVATVFLATGSAIYTSTSQGLWSQTGAIFSQAFSLVFLVPFAGCDARPKGPLHRGMLVVSGFLAGWSVICRPTFGIWLAVYAIAVVFVLKKKSWIPLGGVAVALLIGVWLNTYSSGGPFGSYASKAVGEAGFTADPGHILGATTGLLLSPARGMLIFSPWLILVPVSFAFLLSRRRWSDPLTWTNALFVLLTFLVLATFRIWWGGWTICPRLHADLLFSAALLCCPIIKWLLQRTWGIAILLLLFLPSAFVHHQGAYCLQNLWEANLPSETEAEHLWDWKHGAWHWAATQGRIEREMQGQQRYLHTWTRPILDVSNPMIQDFLGYGLKYVGDPPTTWMKAREAAWAFKTPEYLQDQEVMFALELDDSLGKPALRTIDLSVNGRHKQTFRMVSSMGRRATYLLVPPGTLGREPYDRFELRERYPPRSAFGDAYLEIQILALYPADAENAVLLREKIDEEMRRIGLNDPPKQ